MDASEITSQITCDHEVLDKFKEFPFLIPVVREAIAKVREYAPGSELHLIVYPDWENEGNRELTLDVILPYRVDEAFEIQRKFKHDWWLAQLNKKIDPFTVVHQQFHISWAIGFTVPQQQPNTKYSIGFDEEVWKEVSHDTDE